MADNEFQSLLEESFETVPPLEIEFCKPNPSGNRMARLVAQPGPLVVRYRAMVDLT